MQAPPHFSGYVWLSYWKLTQGFGPIKGCTTHNRNTNADTEALTALSRVDIKPSFEVSLTQAGKACKPNHAYRLCS